MGIARPIQRTGRCSTITVSAIDTVVGIIPQPGRNGLILGRLSVREDKNEGLTAIDDLRGARPGRRVIGPEEVGITSAGAGNVARGTGLSGNQC